MSERDDIRALLEEAVAISEADETQVGFGGGRLQVARFAGNKILSLVEERWARLTMRVARWHPGDLYTVGEASVANTQPKDLIRLARWAGQNAQLREPSEDYLPLPHAGDFESTLSDVASAFDHDTATASPAVVADTVAQLALPCLRAGFECEGTLTLGVGTLRPSGDVGLAALANMNGLFQLYKPTRITVEARVRGPSGGLARVDADSHSLAHLGLEERVETALGRAALPMRPEAVPSGPVRALLGASAVASLLELLRPHLAADRITLDASPFAARFGSQIFGSSIDLSLDPSHLLLLERPFDHLGWPRRPAAMIEGGVLRRLLIDRTPTVAGSVPSRTARDDTRVAGYTELVDGAPHGVAAVPRHVVMRGGELPDADLLDALAGGDASGQSALVIGRFVAVELAPANTFNVSALTGDDVYLVRNGRLEARLGPIRVRGRLDRWLGDEIVLGQIQRVGDSVAPSVVVDGVTVG